jgi:hypothetical protein
MNLSNNFAGTLSINNFSESGEKSGGIVAGMCSVYPIPRTTFKADGFNDRLASVISNRRDVSIGGAFMNNAD